MNKLKRYLFVFSRTICQRTWSKPCNEGQSRDLTDFVYSLCFEFELSIDSGKFYDHIQYFSHITAVIDPAEKF